MAMTAGAAVNRRQIPHHWTRFNYMANDPEGKDNTTPDDEISEEILDDVNGGNDYGVDRIA
jgi:hypothetical protein